MMVIDMGRAKRAPAPGGDLIARAVEICAILSGWCENRWGYRARRSHTVVCENRAERAPPPGRDLIGRAAEVRVARVVLLHESRTDDEGWVSNVAPSTSPQRF
jgi:hypothetical protein